ncbi:hypothetical protein [Streptomyces griseosporeus]|uniref:hypothetical protein n=1 Tax=Streptomyces griseosporeus TaxID=1910 RepID=UPI0036C7F88A
MIIGINVGTDAPSATRLGRTPRPSTRMPHVTAGRLAPGKIAAEYGERAFAAHPV